MKAIEDDALEWHSFFPRDAKSRYAASLLVKAWVVAILFHFKGGLFNFACMVCEFPFISRWSVDVVRLTA